MIVKINLQCVIINHFPAWSRDTEDPIQVFKELNEEQEWNNKCSVYGGKAEQSIMQNNNAVP